MAEKMIPLLLDTDPGSDIDDAVAISYLLRQPFRNDETRINQ